MDGDGGSGGGGQEDLVGAGAAETSESTRETLDDMGYATTGTADPDSERADASPGSPTHIVIKVFAVVLIGLVLALFVLGSGLV